MAISSPVILVIGGAWHEPLCYGLLMTQIEALGYECLVPRLPTVCGIRGLTWEADVAMIHELVLPLFEQGKEVVICGHSYGGIPACAATEGLSVGDRLKAGQRGGFRAIIYMAGFAVPMKGMDLVETLGGVLPDWMSPELPLRKGNSLSRVKPEAKSIFYNDLPHEDAQEWYDRLVTHSQDAVEAPVQYVAADLTMPRYYLICELDRAILVVLQEQLVASILGMRVRRIEAGHSPFLSQPGRTAELIVEMAQEAVMWGVEMGPRL
ncbi:Uu.00g140300.m01.CDS01 [Anthostomella pinea]|uniref:Uu.00g140300.m01.CDS01 n=1 Tax=Anthostomella pinea TaxID=933095 RepID=A0AAI8YLE2_9PEZI|nr:Uu.00g140300.m01.CDS01 [Anthostomella pinea]